MSTTIHQTWRDILTKKYEISIENYENGYSQSYFWVIFTRKTIAYTYNGYNLYCIGLYVGFGEISRNSIPHHMEPRYITSRPIISNSKKSIRKFWLIWGRGVAKNVMDFALFRARIAHTLQLCRQILSGKVRKRCERGWAECPHHTASTHRLRQLNLGGIRHNRCCFDLEIY